MKYDFDKIIERRGTCSMKWDSSEKRVGVREVLPMWVADMDFTAPQPVIDALRKRVDHGIYGYTDKPESYYEAVVLWMKKRFKWDVEQEWIAFTPGVITALCISIQAYTAPGDKVIIQQPVYYPFPEVIRSNDRTVLNNPLKIDAGRYVMDYTHLKSIIDPGTKMLVLCSPHNPVGRVWTKEELLLLAEICLEHDIVLVSDEIHADLVMSGHKHTPTAALSPEIANITVTCNAPTKTFNIAGLEVGYAIIPDKNRRRLFKKSLSRTGLMLSNMFGIVALEAAYILGEEWLGQLLDYVESNYLYLKSFIKKNMPQVKAYPLEGTYLVWLDFRDCGLSDKQLRDLFLHEAKIWLVDGPKFGPGGEGFQRINIACPRKILEEGLQRIAAVLRR
ncbi:MAG: PatB family C-S lyase [Candidatus Aminicenantes bacterium]|nr:PatB family C-S lyase [Candidatus Aminicenantes bacterium]